MKVEQFYNANQFHIYGVGYDALQSYASLVAKVENGVLTLGRHWDYSKTTLKHVYLFLEEYSDVNLYEGKANKRAYIQKLIDNGQINYDENMI